MSDDDPNAREAEVPEDEDAEGSTLTEAEENAADAAAEAWLRTNDQDHAPGRYNPAPTPMQERKQERQRRRDAGHDAGVVYSTDVPYLPPHLFAPSASQIADERRPAESELDGDPEPDYKSPTGDLDADDLLAAFGSRRSVPQAELEKLMPTNRLTRAKRILGLTRRKIGFGPGSYTVWELPNSPG